MRTRLLHTIRAPRHLSKGWPSCCRRRCRSHGTCRSLRAKPGAGCAGRQGWPMGPGVINGVSTLLVPLPLRYAAVVPAQNASGCPMPRHAVSVGASLLARSERNKANMTAYVTDRNAIHGQRPRIPARRAIWPSATRPGRAEQWAQGLVSQQVAQTEAHPTTREMHWNEHNQIHRDENGISS